MTIDFRFIRCGDRGARAAFEEFVCQLARRSPPSDAVEFRRIEGAGGDGGIEGYWLRCDGRKTGYQAKYHLHVRDIDWRKIDQSIRTALKNHSELDEYVVAMPCNLTDHSGNTARSRTGWGQWDIHKAKWLGWAAAKGRTVAFEIWTAFEFDQRLQNPANAGFVRYWFDLLRFDAAWFKKHLGYAIENLDERYHPEDHVEVHVQEICEGLARTRRIREVLRQALEGLTTSYSDLAVRLAACRKHPPDLLRRSLDLKVNELLAVISILDVLSVTPWPLVEWQARCGQAAESVRALQLWTQEHFTRGTGQDYTEQAAEKAIRDVQSDLSRLEVLLSGVQMKAEARRRALLVGAAGTGKSHLLADAAQKAANEERPVLLLLGQHFLDADPWSQILVWLDLSGYDREKLLGALDAAAEAARTRTLIIIDALNEGAGLRLWRDRLAGFLAEIASYPNLCVVVSCRSEYRDHLVSRAVIEQVVEVECRGFETPEEQEGAARQYMEKRGIVRPASPWLAPEFVNPLFLRACCIGLQKNGSTEFPRGLRGTKAVLAFYLESVGRQLDPQYAGTGRLVGSTRRAILDLAADMATNRRDHVAISAARDITAGAFGPSTPFGKPGWLDVLLGAGVLRRDPNPYSDPGDPLDISEEVVRFAFQRFADHLICDALLQQVANVIEAFAPEGPLAFIIGGGEIDWEWRGIAYALAIQLPQAKGVELVDALPDGAERWWKRGYIRDGFEESLLWRSTDAFTDRTAELLNRLGNYSDGAGRSLRTLLQLAVVQGHPWNMERLNRKLRILAMPDRDAVWSLELAFATEDHEHPVHRLIDWAWRADKTRASDETLWLTALALTWCFTTSSRPIRDRATKALTAVLLARPELYRPLIEKFNGVDDPYVLERLLAAGYGVVCARPAIPAIAGMALVTHAHIFAETAPPVQLLTRDYALGILEAAHLGALPAGIDLDRCRPPYGSAWPLADVSEEDIKRTIELAGDDGILHSAGDWGDFGRYQVDPAVRHFSIFPLTGPAPLSSQEKLAGFEKSVVGTDPKRRERFNRLRTAIKSSASIRFVVAVVRAVESNSRGEAGGINSTVGEIVLPEESEFLALLGDDERELYAKLALPELAPSRVTEAERRIPTIDLGGAHRWVVKRAYDFGWTKARFARETELSGDYSQSRPQLERMGKKYQWLALRELLARLADNLWLTNWDDEAFACDSPCKVGFQRDVDPTIFVWGQDVRGERDIGAPWWLPRKPEFPPVADDLLLKWPFSDSKVINGPDLLDVTDRAGHRWIVLHSFVEADEGAERSGTGIPFRRNLFTRVSTLLVAATDAERAASHLHGKRLTGPTTSNPSEVIDGAFLLESPWRATWPEGGWLTNAEFLPGMKHVLPVFRYVWESHLDASLTEGFATYLPTPWLIHQLGLRSRPLAPGQYEDSAGRLIFQDPGRGNAALVDREAFIRFLKANGLECLWIVAGERNAWPDGSHERWACRYHSAVYRWTESGWTGNPWFEDQRRDRRSGRAQAAGRSSKSNNQAHKC